MSTLVFALFIASQSAAQSLPGRRADSRAWYQAYSDGIKLIDQKNWQAAIDSLEAAKRAGGAPKPGKNVPFYGDVYKDFIPDYYLGVAYLNLKQYTQADRAFAGVRASGLIGPNDRSYPQFETQATAARSGALQAQTPVQNASTAPGAGGAAAANGTPTAGLPSAIQQTTPPSNTAATSVVQQPPAQTPSPPIAQTQQAPSGSKIPSPPVSNSAANVGNSRPVAPIRPNPTIAPGSGVAANEQAAIGAYLSGQYDQASALLSNAVAGRGATPRAYFYLACSRTALAILGQGDAASIKDARENTLKRAGDPAQFIADRRYISPRILEQLGLNQ